MATIGELLATQVTRITGEISEQTTIIEQLATALQGKGIENETPDPVLQEKTVDPTTEIQTVVADEGYDGLSNVTVNAMPTATQATPTISVSETGLITASAEQTAGYVEAGTSELTHQLPVQEAQTITPSTENQVIQMGKYLTGDQTVLGDENLIAENIKKDIDIFGVVGTYESEYTSTGVPPYSYTGTYQLIDDGDGNWRIKFLTSGTLTIGAGRAVDIFCVGGGANGTNRYSADTSGGGGGGGGYTSTVKNSVLEAGTYIVTVGAASGESSLADEAGMLYCSAAGGNKGVSSGGTYTGGAGGSGGGGGGVYLASGGNGGFDGASGTGNHVSAVGGAGQGTTTREFGEETGDLYAGGGGGGGGAHDGSNGSAGSGGSGGGGNGATYAVAATPGEDNTGGGGGGGASSTNSSGAAGGSGIVIIRNART